MHTKIVALWWLAVLLRTERVLNSDPTVRARLDYADRDNLLLFEVSQNIMDIIFATCQLNIHTNRMIYNSYYDISLFKQCDLSTQTHTHTSTMLFYVPLQSIVYIYYGNNMLC